MDHSFPFTDATAWNDVPQFKAGIEDIAARGALEKSAEELLYTLNHKKRDILFLTITLANLNRFL